MSQLQELHKKVKEKLASIRLKITQLIKSVKERSWSFQTEDQPSSVKSNASFKKTNKNSFKYCVQKCQTYTECDGKSNEYSLLLSSRSRTGSVSWDYTRGRNLDLNQSIYLLTEISNPCTTPKSLRICLCNSYCWKIQLLLPTEHETAAENTLQLYRR